MAGLTDQLFDVEPRNQRVHQKGEKIPTTFSKNEIDLNE
jgi:hypothetical protein